MAGCEDFRERLGLLVDGQLEVVEASELSEHLADCSDCRELADAMRMIGDALAPMADIEPPSGLAEEIGASPCRRWLGLLYTAVDRAISERNLERLLPHLESCDACRRAWNDLTLIHQLGDAMVPPPDLLDRCLTVHRRPERITRVLSRRTAAAAAYVLAVLATLMVGNPGRIIEAQEKVRLVADRVTSEVGIVTDDSRGEARVMLWRTLQWGAARIDTVRDLLNPNDDTDPEEGELTDELE